LVERKRLQQQRAEGLAMSLATPGSVQKLQKALHDKAKESPSYRFYASVRQGVPEGRPGVAYDRCDANRRAAGVDGQEFEDIEEYGVERWLDQLAEELRSGTYQPQAVRRVMIDKPGSGGGIGSSAGARTDFRSQPAA
jgi:hypothetical protein